MGFLADQKEAVSQAVQSKVREDFGTRDIQPTVSQDDGRLRASPVIPIDEPVRTIQTKNRLAASEILNQTDNPINLRIVPFKDDEVYGIDIANEEGKIVFTIPVQNGKFNSRIPLPKGKYQLLIKTQQNDMPFSVVKE